MDLFWGCTVFRLLFFYLPVNSSVPVYIICTQCPFIIQRILVDFRFPERGAGGNMFMLKHNILEVARLYAMSQFSSFHLCAPPLPHPTLHLVLR